MEALKHNQERQKSLALCSSAVISFTWGHQKGKKVSIAGEFGERGIRGIEREEEREGTERTVRSREF
jgi:hypothetical protein